MTMSLGGVTSSANATGVNAVAQVIKVVGGVEQNVSDAAWQSGSGLELKDSLGDTIGNAGGYGFDGRGLWHPV